MAPCIDWRHSEARQILWRDLEKGDLSLQESKVSTKAAWERYRHLPAFANVPWRQFKSNLANHRRQILKLRAKISRIPRHLSALAPLLLQDHTGAYSFVEHLLSYLDFDTVLALRTSNRQVATRIHQIWAKRLPHLPLIYECDGSDIDYLDMMFAVRHVRDGTDSEDSQEGNPEEDDDAEDSEDGHVGHDRSSIWDSHEALVNDAIETCRKHVFDEERYQYDDKVMQPRRKIFDRQAATLMQDRGFIQSTDFLAEGENETDIDRPWKVSCQFQQPISPVAVLRLMDEWLANCARHISFWSDSDTQFGNNVKVMRYRVLGCLLRLADPSSIRVSSVDHDVYQNDWHKFRIYFRTNTGAGDENIEVQGEWFDNYSQRLRNQRTHYALWRYSRARRSC
jgi:hypothetical protein